MATETEYQVFKALYDEESTRYAELESRAKLYLTIITFYLGAIAFKLEDITKFLNEFNVPKWPYVFSGLLLIIALLLTILGTRIMTFEGQFDPEEVYKTSREKPLKDFLDDRLVDLAVATNRNSVTNNSIATFLEWASYFLFAAVAIQMLIFAFALVRA